jgi:hypothetical protein
MTRDQVRELSENVHAYAYRADYYDPFDPHADKLDQKLANVRCTHRATFCGADGDMWTIRFNPAVRVISWIEKPFAENC